MHIDHNTLELPHVTTFKNNINDIALENEAV